MCCVICVAPTLRRGRERGKGNRESKGKKKKKNVTHYNQFSLVFEMRNRSCLASLFMSFFFFFFITALFALLSRCGAICFGKKKKKCDTRVVFGERIWCAGKKKIPSASLLFYLPLIYLLFLLFFFFCGLQPLFFFFPSCLRRFFHFFFFGSCFSFALLITAFFFPG